VEKPERHLLLFVDETGNNFTEELHSIGSRAILLLAGVLKSLHRLMLFQLRFGTVIALVNHAPCPPGRPPQTDERPFRFGHARGGI
jgi:hypothetical protein